jgi:hypothetical protein
MLEQTIIIRVHIATLFAHIKLAVAAVVVMSQPLSSE